MLKLSWLAVALSALGLACCGEPQTSVPVKPPAPITPAPVAVADTWFSCDSKCLLRMRAESADACDTEGPAWDVGQAAVSASLRKAWGTKSTLRPLEVVFTAAVRGAALEPFRREMLEKKSIARLMVTKRTGWVDIHALGFHSGFCIEIHNESGVVSLVPRQIYFIEH